LGEPRFNIVTASLRRVIRNATGQDVHACHACFDCDVPLTNEMDIPLGSLIQLVLQNDEEALHCRTLWSDPVLEASRGACKRGLDLHAVMLALREESTRRIG
jgi:hypothetical protein